MTQPFEYKSDEWYHEMSEKVVDLFDGVKASNGDIMVVMATVLKAMAHVGSQDGFPEPLIFEGFRDIYFKMGIRENNEDEVKKE